MNHDVDPPNNDYLWTGRGAPDPDVAALERQLRPLAWKPDAWRGLAQPRPLPRPVRRRSHWRGAVVALAATVLLCWGLHGWYGYRLSWPEARPWQVESSQGEVRVDGARLGADAALPPGRLLETGADGIVRLQAARIGELAIGENSRFELIQTRAGRAPGGGEGTPT
jgi:hypothetical protein